jgi:SAM-dependent methyltransferase
MSQFSPEWLDLREAHDIAARNPAVLEAVKNAFRTWSAISVLDLACGTGSTLRAVHGALPTRQEWILVDNDAMHLAQAAALGAPHDIILGTMTMDLAAELESALTGSFHFVTTSALLDLVSSKWLDRLLISLSLRQLPFYAALTYDGRAVVEPVDALDADVLACFNAHQRSDKGFGPALGPDAASVLARCVARHGYVTVQGRSDWVLEPHDHAIQELVFLAWAAAAKGTIDGAQLQSWLARRRAYLAQGRSTLRVGHMDCFAYPMGLR